MAEIDLGKVVGATGETGPKGETGEAGPQGPPGPQGVVDGNSTITFSTPGAYEEPVSGNSIAVLFGRFKRWILNLQDDLGPLSSLKTPDKSSAVAAVNANYDSIAQLEQDIGNPADLTTDAKEVVGAVNELNSALGGWKIGTVTLSGMPDQTGRIITDNPFNSLRVVVLQNVTDYISAPPPIIAISKCETEKLTLRVTKGAEWFTGNVSATLLCAYKD